MVGIIDYGVGNLFSLQSSFKAIGQQVEVSADPEVLRKADHILLPGVGAFEDAVQKLRSTGMDQMVYEAVRSGKPLMGICLGMQMLFEKSYEYGEHQGLGLLKGEVIPMAGLLPQELKIPHMGWNALHITQPDGKLRLRGKGMPIYKSDGERGDLIVTFHVHIPTTLTPEQRELFERLRATVND